MNESLCCCEVPTRSLNVPVEYKYLNCELLIHFILKKIIDSIGYRSGVAHEKIQPSSNIEAVRMSNDRNLSLQPCVFLVYLKFHIFLLLIKFQVELKCLGLIENHCITTLGVDVYFFILIVSSLAPYIEEHPVTFFTISNSYMQLYICVRLKS